MIIIIIETKAKETLLFSFCNIFFNLFINSKFCHHFITNYILIKRVRANAAY